MATAVTWGRWRVRSLLAWTLPGLVMRVPEDPANSNLKLAETHFAPTLSVRTTDGVQHQIAVLQENLEARGRSECEEVWQRDRVTADHVARWKTGVHTVHTFQERAMRWTTKECRCTPREHGRCVRVNVSGTPLDEWGDVAAQCKALRWIWENAGLASRLSACEASTFIFRDSKYAEKTTLRSGR